jgi:hypothetical protein
VGKRRLDKELFANQKNRVSAESLKPLFVVAPPAILLSSQFQEDLVKIYDLKAVLELIPFKPADTYPVQSPSI